MECNYIFIFYIISFFILKKNTKVINLPSPPLTLDPFISAPFNSFLHSYESNFGAVALYFI